MYQKNYNNMKNYLVLLFLSLGIFANAQSWDTLTYNPNQPGLELNPLKGFATMWDTENNFPHSIQGKLFGLNALMIDIDSFDWTPIDDFIAQEASEGNHAYLQVNIDGADGNFYMPDFLMNQVDTLHYFHDNGANGVCPDWNDPELIAAMLNFINAFGEKYNNDSKIFMVHLGLYGMWGEWHIGDTGLVRPDFKMNEANKASIANAFKTSFDKTLLLARYPENMPDPEIYGYSDGLFFGESISDTEIGYFHNTLKFNKADLNWKQLPIGGEITPALQPIIFDVLPNTVGQDVYESLEAIRPTWLFCHHMLTAAVAGSQEWNNGLEVQKKMGYTFSIDKYHVSAENGNPAIEVNVLNKGLTPMYANWDVEVGAINASGQFKSLGITKWDINVIQPEVDNNYRSFISDSTLVDGTYNILLRIKNPLEPLSADANPVRFANTTQDQHLPGWITLGTATLSAGNVGTFPEEVTNLTLTPSFATMRIAESLQLQATIAPSTATNTDITWVSDHPTNVSVDANGLVNIKGAVQDTVIISAYTQDGGFVKECKIVVEQGFLIPALIEAEDYVDMSGIVNEMCPDIGGGFSLGYMDTNDWMEYTIIVDSAADFTLDIRAVSPYGIREICVVDEMGVTLAIIPIPNTSPIDNSWEDYETITSDPISLPVGTYNLKLKICNGGFNLNWVEYKYYVPPVPLTFCSTADKPQIDGVADCFWENIPAKQIDNPLFGTVTSTTDNSGSFKTFWDAEALYLFVTIMDDILINDTPGVTPWNNDGLELFIDGDNSKGTSYDANDHQLILNVSDATVFHQSTGQQNPTGVSFTEGTIAGGYTMEIKIDWTFIGVSATPEAAIGFDLHVNDDDDGGGGDSKLTFTKLTSGDSYNNPSLHSTVFLSSGACLEGNCCLDLNIAAFLEGAYDDTAGQMTNELHTPHQLLPGMSNNTIDNGQPYIQAPWNYAGTEGLDWTAADYPVDAVDWVLVSLRANITKESQVYQAAGILHTDGTISFPEGCPLASLPDPAYYVVVAHRNHIAAMTPAAVVIANRQLAWDFRIQDSYAGIALGQYQLSPGTWGLYSGDGDQGDAIGYDINGIDKTLWATENGISLNYFGSDFNLDGDINAADKLVWEKNNGVFSLVPK